MAKLNRHARGGDASKCDNCGSKSIEERSKNSPLFLTFKGKNGIFIFSNLFILHKNMRPREKFLSDIRFLKEKYALEIIDSHVHPFDVMGIKHYNEVSGNSGKAYDFTRPGIMEELRFGWLANFSYSRRGIRGSRI